MIIAQKIEEKIHKGPKVSTADINKIANQVIKTTYDFFIGLSRLPTLPTTFEKVVHHRFCKLVKPVAG